MHFWSDKKKKKMRHIAQGCFEHCMFTITSHQVLHNQVPRYL